MPRTTKKEKAAAPQKAGAAIKPKPKKNAAAVKVKKEETTNMFDDLMEKIHDVFNRMRGSGPISAKEKTIHKLRNKKN